MTMSDEEDENLAHFLESDLLYEVSDQDDVETEKDPKAKRRRLVEEQIGNDLQSEMPHPQQQEGSSCPSTSGFVRSQDYSNITSENNESCRAPPKRIETGIFSKIPPELFTDILKFLSSEDLISCALVCKFLSSVASDESLWRRLYSIRWGLPPSKKLRECPWKKLYIQRDEKDMKELVRNCQPEFKEYYIQMQTAKRSQAPLPSQVIDDRIILDKTVAEQVSIWKSSRGLTDKVVTDHACSGETCTYHQIGDVFVCEKTGNVHVCDDTCRETVVDANNELLVCTISGHCFDRLLVSAEIETDELQENGVTDEAEPFMGSGRFARAYLLGYNCADETELEAALRFCSW